MEFNAAVLIICFINFLLMTLGAFFWYPRLFGTLCNCCCSCCHCLAWAAALAVRFNPVGIWCGFNVAPIQYEGNRKFNDSHTFKSDGGILAAFGILQLIFWCCQCYCCWLPLYWTPEASGASSSTTVKTLSVDTKDKKKKKKKDGNGSSS